jgi:hypothetical protein
MSTPGESATRPSPLEAAGGPWWREKGIAPSEEEHMVWLRNEANDTLMVNADDVAMLVNAASEREAATQPEPAATLSIEDIADALYRLPGIENRTNTIEMLADNLYALLNGRPLVWKESAASPSELDPERLWTIIEANWPKHTEGTGGTGEHVQEEWWEVIDPGIPTRDWVDHIVKEYGAAAPSSEDER